MAVSLTLYRSLSRVVHDFAKLHVPLTGAVGTTWAAPTADNIGYLQDVFRTSPPPQATQIDGAYQKCLSTTNGSACMVFTG